jgi:hypothetical protein
MHSAAGGTIQRLNPGLAIVRLRSKNDNILIKGVHPWSDVRPEIIGYKPIESGPRRLATVALVRIDGSPRSPGGLLQIDGLIMAGLVQLRPRHLM